MIEIPWWLFGVLCTCAAPLTLLFLCLAGLFGFALFCWAMDCLTDLRRKILG